MTLSKINLLYIMLDLGIKGGAENVVTSLALNLDKSRYNVVICCLVEGDGRLADILRSQNIPVFILGRRHKLDLRVLHDLIRLMRQQKTHIVHCHLYRAIIYGALAGRLAGVPIMISTEHGMLNKEAGSVFGRRLICPLLDAITTVSHAVKDAVVRQLNFDPNKVFVIYNGVKEVTAFSTVSATQLRETLGINHSYPLIGTASRMTPLKDPLTFVEAACLVVKAGIQAHFLMIGKGPLQDVVRNHITDLKLTSYFTLIDHTDDIYSMFSLLDIFVLNSLEEGLGLVLLEAMLLGKPTIGTDVAGINEVIDKETGLLVPPRDPAALSKAIIRLILDPTMRERMGQAGRLRATQKFSIEKQVREMTALYEKLICKKEALKPEHL